MAKACADVKNTWCEGEEVGPSEDSLSVSLGTGEVARAGVDSGLGMDSGSMERDPASCVRGATLSEEEWAMSATRGGMAGCAGLARTGTRLTSGKRLRERTSEQGAVECVERWGRLEEEMAAEVVGESKDVGQRGERANGKGGPGLDAAPMGASGSIGGTPDGTSWVPDTS